MSEAVRQIYIEAFALLSITRISADVFSPNIASQKVLLHHHFKQEGTLKNAVCKNGVFYDLLLFGKLK